MKTAIVYKDVYFTPDERYYIDEDGVISANVNKLTCHYTTLSNGIDYVVLRNAKGKLGLYSIAHLTAFVLKKRDVLMNTWRDAFDQPHFDIEYIDGNSHNNHPSNIRVSPVNEVWKRMVYPENVVKDMYMISSHGRIRNMVSGKFLKTGTENSEYPVVSLSCVMDDKTLQKKAVKLHRLIAFHFVKNPDPVNLQWVDHIDGNKSNGEICNLQWVTSDTNAKLASKSGLANMSAISTFEVDLVISLLLELNGSIKQVYEAIDHTMYPNLTEAVINDIKHHDHAYIRYDSKYDLKNIEFKKRTRKADLTDDEIEEICKAIVECKFSIGDALQYLHDKGMTHIARHDVRHIRDKSKRCDISDKYFSRDDYEHPKTPMTDTEIIEVCKALVKHNGNIAKATKEMNANGYENVTNFNVQDIKYKKKRPDISNIFFTYDDKVFKPI